VWLQPRNARHAAIGALIGFGLGAALGAKANKDQHVGARIGAPILFGGFGALIGAVIGGSHP
jgi:phosphate/sulfate permease